MIWRSLADEMSLPSAANEERVLYTTLTHLDYFSFQLAIMKRHADQDETVSKRSRSSDQVELRYWMLPAELRDMISSYESHHPMFCILVREESPLCCISDPLYLQYDGQKNLNGFQECIEAP